MHSHADEIKYWAEHPDNTKVWYRNTKRKKWYKTSVPEWLPEFIYIVDDEWTELRKAQADGKQLQSKHIYGFEDEILGINDLEGSDISFWRIKPEEPIYEYQWICKTHLGKYFIPNSYFVKKEAVEGYICDNYTVVEPYEPSKRKRK